MKLILIALSLLTLTSCTNAQLGNTLYGTSIGLLAVDWGQTRSIVRHPERWGEGNPALGPHPTFTQVDTYFPAWILGTAVSYPFIKPEYRPYVYGLITALEGYCVGHNVRNGLHIDFIGVKF